VLRGLDLALHAIVCSPDGRQVVRAHATGPSSEPTEIGRRVADDLAAQGARGILEAARGADGPVQGSY
jgi:hydroxymethylbilane synthase